MYRVTASLLVLLLALSVSAADRVLPRPEVLPVVNLESLRGQTVAVALHDAYGVTILGGFLREDIERSLTESGVTVAANAPLVLDVTLHYISSDFRLGRWESCGRMSGQLFRDGKAMSEKFTSNYCTNVTPNPWERAASQPDDGESRSRTYFGMLRAFFADLEKVAAAK